MPQQRYEHPERLASAGLATRELRKVRRSLARARERGDERAAGYLLNRLTVLGDAAEKCGYRGRPADEWWSS